MSPGRDDPWARRLVAANWKMHLLRADTAAFCERLRAELPQAQQGGAPRIVVFPSFPLIPPVAEALTGSPVALGGQDLHPEDKGAHTGDVSGAQLADAGCSWALCGHSERRRDHGEPDALVGRKAAAAVRHGLTPMICVGETRDERRGGRTFEVLERQLRAALGGLDILGVLEDLDGRAGSAPFALAYEPVWAIGTGETATPETAQEAHRFLRGLLGELLGGGAAAGGISILYGGSVTPDNAPTLGGQPDIDGFLVGGASLDPEKFLSIIRGSV
jgi:triosephosphate isomerase